MKQYVTAMFLGSLALTAAAEAATVYSVASASNQNTFLVANGNQAPLSYSPNSLTYTQGTSNAISYFVGNFATQTLAAGEYIRVDYAFTPSSTSSFISSSTDAFRVGLFNSNGTLLSNSTTANGDATLSDDTGYVAAYAPNSTPSATNSVIKQRATGGNNVLFASATLATVAGSPTLVSPGTGSVTGSFTLTLLASGNLQLDSVINGGATQTVIDSVSPIQTSFNELSIFSNSGTTNPTLTFSTLNVSTGVVPEPGSLALLGGAALLLGRRRGR